VIEDLSGNDLQSIKNVFVDNNTFVDPNVDNRFPEIANAEINSDVLTITLDEDIKPTAPKTNNFKVKIGRKKSKVESVSVDQAADTVVLALKNAALVTDDVTLDYKTKKKDQTTGVIEDLSGNDLQSIKGFSVENNTFVDPNLDLTAPTIVSAEINGDVLTITLDEDIDSTNPKTKNFKVKNGRKKIKVEAVLVDTDTVVLSLKDAVEASDTDITLDYKTKKKDQVTGVIQDLAGNDLQSTKGYKVENITPAAKTSDQTKGLNSLDQDALMASSEVFDTLGSDQENPFLPFVDPLA